MTNFHVLKIAKNAMRFKGKREVEGHGFWYVDVPRTSSSSIRTELSREFGPSYGKNNILDKPASATSQVFDDHIPAIIMQKILGKRRWEKIFTFSIVRNPWDRTLSIYHYRRKVGNIPLEWSFKEYVQNLVADKHNKGHFKYYGFRYGSADFVCDGDGSIIVDYIVRYESREKDLKNVASRIGLKSLGVSRVQAAAPPNTDYRAAYDSETKLLVGDYYSRDVELFEYSFES